MKRFKVYMGEEIHPAAAEKLRNFAEVVDTLEPIEELDAIFSRATKLNRDQISRAKKCKCIARHGVGMDILDVQACKEYGIPILYTPYANSNSVAEFVLAMAMCMARNVYQTEYIMKTEGFHVIGPAWLRGCELRGKTVGIVGVGRIGSIVARLFKTAFDCRVVAYDPYLSADELAVRHCEKVDALEQLVSSSDIVSINCPLNDETKHMFNKELFSNFKPDAFLINTARGQIVDEDAAYEALTTGKLKMMGTDVYVDELNPFDCPLTHLDNFIGFPHVAANTHEAMYNMAMTAVDGIIDMLEGRTPKYIFQG